MVLIIKILEMESYLKIKINIVKYILYIFGILFYIVRIIFRNSNNFDFTLLFVVIIFGTLLIIIGNILDIVFNKEKYKIDDIILKLKQYIIIEKYNKCNVA